MDESGVGERDQSVQGCDQVADAMHDHLERPEPLFLASEQETKDEALHALGCLWQVMGLVGHGRLPARSASAGVPPTLRLERVDDSPQGLLLYVIMAGVNAFRSRGDGEKVKGGLARKHADGGTIGQARIGYLNDTELVQGRKVATVTVDPDRAHFVQLAFDLAATGEHSITTITDILEDVGLRTRATIKRPSHPLSRSMVHRMLRDDYYIGVVTHNGVKNPGGRHEALVDRATFARSAPPQRRPLP